MARPNGKLVVGARMIYKRKMKDGEFKSICHLRDRVGRGGTLSTHPPQRQHESGHAW